jgi:hypothetical protein
MAGKLVSLAQEMNPTFKVLVPSLNRSVKFRSFLVKEQKLLLVAKEAKENQVEAITNAVTQLIQNCVKEDLDITQLPSFDIEYIFVQLFMSSTGKKTSNAWYKCKAPIGEGDEKKECGEINKVVVDLKKAHVPGSAIRTGFIDVNSETIEKIKLRYPTFDEMVDYDLAVAEDRHDDAFSLYGKCLVNVFKKGGELLVLGEDYEADDAVELLEYFSGDVFTKVTEFFKDSPSITGETEYHCKKCGNKSNLKLRGLEDFF